MVALFTGLEFDTDAAAFILASGITNTIQKNAIDELVRSLKSAGLWSLMDAIYPMVGGTSTTHKFNLKDPRDLDAAYRLTFVGSPTHNASGVDFNGSSQYCRTAIIPATVTSGNNSFHMSYYCNETPGAANLVEMGANGLVGGVTARQQLTYRWGDGGSGYFSGNTAINGATSNNGGLLVGQNASSQGRLYKNGLQVASSGGVIVNWSPSEVYLGGYNNFGAGTSSTRRCAFASVGRAITDPVAFYNIVQAFQTALGRQV